MMNEKSNRTPREKTRLALDHLRQAHCRRYDQRYQRVGWQPGLVSLTMANDELYPLSSMPVLCYALDVFMIRFLVEAQARWERKHG